MSTSNDYKLEAGDAHQKYRTIAGKQILIDKEGFLWYSDDWDERIATALAAESGIDQLSDDQWRVIRFLRDYFAYYGRAPLNRDLKKGLQLSLLELEGLFPDGIRRSARRVAGLPNPRTCTG